MSWCPWKRLLGLDFFASNQGLGRWLTVVKQLNKYYNLHHITLSIYVWFTSYSYILHRWLEKMGISWDITESKRAFDVRWLSAHLWSKKRRNCQGLPAPKELTLQSCLLDRASILMLQVVLPSALLLGPSSHQVWQGKRNEREKTWLKPIHLTRCCSPFKFCFCMSTILLHVSSIWAKYTMVDGFWFIHHSSSIVPI